MHFVCRWVVAAGLISMLSACGEGVTVDGGETASPQAPPTTAATAPTPTTAMTSSTTEAIGTAAVDADDEVDPGPSGSGDPSLSEWGIGFCEATIATRGSGDRERPTLTDTDHPGEQFADAAREAADSLAEYGRAIEALGTPPTGELQYAVAGLANAIDHDVPVILALADVYDAVGPDSPGGGDDEIQALDDEVDTDFDEAWEAVLTSEDLGLGRAIVRVPDESTTTTPDDRERALIAESGACQQLMMSFLHVG